MFEKKEPKKSYSPSPLVEILPNYRNYFSFHRPSIIFRPLFYGTFCRTFFLVQANRVELIMHFALPRNQDQESRKI